MSQYAPKFDLKINIGHYNIFHGPVTLPYILKTDVCTSYFGSMNQYDQTFDLKLM